jgi:hypothetical protein
MKSCKRNATKEHRKKYYILHSKVCKGELAPFYLPSKSSLWWMTISLSGGYTWHYAE